MGQEFINSNNNEENLIKYYTPDIKYNKISISNELSYFADNVFQIIFSLNYTEINNEYNIECFLYKNKKEVLYCKSEKIKIKKDLEEIKFKTKFYLSKVSIEYQIIIIKLYKNDKLYNIYEKNINYFFIKNNSNKIITNNIQEVLSYNLIGKNEYLFFNLELKSNNKNFSFKDNRIIYMITNSNYSKDNYLYRSEIIDDNGKFIEIYIPIYFLKPIFRIIFFNRNGKKIFSNKYDPYNFTYNYFEKNKKYIEFLYDNKYSIEVINKCHIELIENDETQDIYINNDIYYDNIINNINKYNKNIININEIELKFNITYPKENSIYKLYIQENNLITNKKQIIYKNDINVNYILNNYIYFKSLIVNFNLNVINSYTFTIINNNENFIFKTTLNNILINKYVPYSLCLEQNIYSNNFNKEKFIISYKNINKINCIKINFSIIIKESENIKENEYVNELQEKNLTPYFIYITNYDNKVKKIYKILKTENKRNNEEKNLLEENGNKINNNENIINKEYIEKINIYDNINSFCFLIVNSKNELLYRSEKFSYIKKKFNSIKIPYNLLYNDIINIYFLYECYKDIYMYLDENKQIKEDLILFKYNGSIKNFLKIKNFSIDFSPYRKITLENISCEDKINRFIDYICNGFKIILHIAIDFSWKKNINNNDEKFENKLKELDDVINIIEKSNLNKFNINEKFYGYGFGIKNKNNNDEILNINSKENLMIETFFQLILLYHNLIKKINSSNKRNLKKIIDKVLINNKNKYDFISLIIIINSDFNDEIIKDYFKEINISIIIINVNNENIFQKNSINNNYNVHFINFNEYKTNNLDENKLSNLLLEIVSNDLINYNIIKNEI